MLTLRFILALAICGALLLWLLNRAQDVDGLGDTIESSPLTADYDYYINAMNTTRFLASGEAEYRLQAARLTHYPDGDIAVLEQPRFVWHREQQQPWQVSASSGTLSPDAERDEDRLELNGQVVLEQRGNEGRFTAMRTEMLTVFPGSEEFFTPAAVTLQTQDSEIDSLGMEGWLRENRIKLLNDVRGRYEQTGR